GWAPAPAWRPIERWSRMPGASRGARGLGWRVPPRSRAPPGAPTGRDSTPAKEATMRTRSRAVALLVAGSLAGAAAVAAAAPVTLTFRFNDAEHKELREALDVFERQNPNIKVTLQRIAWADSREQFLREAAVGQGPDVVHVAQVAVRSMGQAGAFLKLNDLVKRNGLRGGWEDFLSTELAAQDDGTIHAIPWTVDTFAMVYNADILKQAGIARFPETWDELREASRQIKAKTGKVGWAFPAGSGSTNSI